MNRDDIIKLAQAAAIKFAHWDDWDSNEPASGPNGNEPHEEREYWISVVEFIADVAYAAGAAAEREVIAQMIEDAPELVPSAKNDQGGCVICGFDPKFAASYIRARGQG